MALHQFARLLQLLRADVASTLVEDSGRVAHVEALASDGNVSYVDFCLDGEGHAAPKHVHTLPQLIMLELPEYLVNSCSGVRGLDPVRILSKDLVTLGTWVVEAWQLRRALFYAYVYQSRRVYLRSGREGVATLGELVVFREPVIGNALPHAAVLLDVLTPPPASVCSVSTSPMLVDRVTQLLGLMDAAGLAHVHLSLLGTRTAVVVHLPPSAVIAGGVLFL